MTGTGAAMLGLLIGVVLLLIMDVNRPQRGRINIGVESLERVRETTEAPSPQALLENGMTGAERTEARLEQVNHCAMKSASILNRSQLND